MYISIYMMYMYVSFIVTCLMTTTKERVDSFENSLTTNPCPRKEKRRVRNEEKERKESEKEKEEWKEEEEMEWFERRSENMKENQRSGILEKR